MSNEGIEYIEPILIEESTDWESELASLGALFDCAASYVSNASQSVLETSEDAEIADGPDLRDIKFEQTPNGWLFQILMD